VHQGQSEHPEGDVMRVPVESLPEATCRCRCCHPRQESPEALGRVHSSKAVDLDQVEPARCGSKMSLNTLDPVIASVVIRRTGGWSEFCSEFRYTGSGLESDGRNVWVSSVTSRRCANAYPRRPSRREHSVRALPSGRSWNGDRNRTPRITFPMAFRARSSWNSHGSGRVRRSEYPDFRASCQEPFDER